LGADHTRIRILDRSRTPTRLPTLLTPEQGPESFANHADRAATHQVYPLPITALLARAGVMEADRFDLLPHGYGMDLDTGWYAPLKVDEAD